MSATLIEAVEPRRLLANFVVTTAAAIACGSGVVRVAAQSTANLASRAAAVRPGTVSSSPSAGR
jgi:hypothetical protein